jgi:hypothetical protein
MFVISKESSAGIVMGYGLHPGSILGRGKNFSLLHSMQIGSGVHTALYPGVPSSEIKQAGA